LPVGLRCGGEEPRESGSTKVRGRRVRLWSGVEAWESGFRLIPGTFPRTEDHEADEPQGGSA